MDTFLSLLPAIVVILLGVAGILKVVNNQTANEVGNAMESILEDLKDRLDPDTNGGVGRGPDNPAG